MVESKEDKKKKVEATAVPVPVPVPLEWYVPEGTITPFAFNMVVQIMEGVFKISFFEVKLPIIIDKDQPPPDKVRADCVASVFVAPDKIPSFIEVLQKHYETYLSITKTP